MARRVKKNKYKVVGRFMPDDFLNEILPEKTWNKNFVSGGLNNLTVQKRIIKTLVARSAITNKDLTETISAVLAGYKTRGRILEKMGVKAYKTEAIKDGVLLKQRVRDAVVYAQVQAEKKEHKGGYYRWLPSSAVNPDPEHQVLYGRIFPVGDGDKDGNMPGERYGCQCGIEWLEKAVE